ncbi:hypothetical protein MAR_015888, partial [Mya arenaria]
SLESSCTQNSHCVDSLNSVCDTTVSGGQCRRRSGKSCTQTSDCLNNGECSGGTCACSTGYQVENNLCKATLGTTCTIAGDCIANALCSGNPLVCSCSSGYEADGTTTCK